MDAFAKSISIGLQYGVPLAMIVRQFVNSRFEPYGFTTNPQIRIAKSIIDYIARYLGIKFLTPEGQVELGIKADGDASSAQTQLDFNGVTAPVKTEEITNGDLVDELPAEASEIEKFGPLGPTSVADQPEVVATDFSPPEEESPAPASLKQQQTDAPACPSCGSLTFKTGTCYTCLSCGSTTGGCS
jgi:ribonucleoside-diphosphate reductase alpha chain